MTLITRRHIGSTARNTDCQFIIQRDAPTANSLQLAVIPTARSAHEDMLTGMTLRTIHIISSPLNACQRVLAISSVLTWQSNEPTCSPASDLCRGHLNFWVHEETHLGVKVWGDEVDQLLLLFCCCCCCLF